MTLRELRDTLDLRMLSGEDNLDIPVSRGYVCDLMSDVIAHGRENDIWVTFQTHINVVAIALMKGIAGVILIQNRELIPQAVEKARAEGLPVLVSSESAFEVVGKLYKAGIPG